MIAKTSKILLVILVLTGLGSGLLLSAGCSGEKKSVDTSLVGKIEGQEQFDKVIKGAGDRLLVLDLYADWCAPCRILSPTLERIAITRRASASIYKINVDRNPGLAQAFGASGIPLVVFVKKGQVVNSVVGVYPQEAYEEMIDKLAR